MVETVATGAIDRAQLFTQLKSIMDSEKLEVQSLFDRDSDSFSLTLRVPVASKNFEAINRVVALSVDSAM